MPKVKPIIRPDPVIEKVRAEIGAGMAVSKLSITDLSRLSGIKYGTLVKRIGRHGDITTMRLGEYVDIMKALNR